MANQSREARYLQRTAVASVAIGLAVYPVSSLISGERGLQARETVRAQIAVRAAELESLQEERKRWQGRIDALDPGHLDLDMLGEQSRRVLFFAGPDEVILRQDER